MQMPPAGWRQGVEVASPVWFWLDVVSPHMAGLVRSLADRGRDVTYVVERTMSARRAAQGWAAPDVGRARLHLASDEGAVARLVADAPPDSIHICLGLRGYPLVGCAQRALAARGLKQWIIMETVDDTGWRGVLKRLEYGRLVRARRSTTEGVLAIGHATPVWLARRGMPPNKVSPFAYFLPEGAALPVVPVEASPFRFLFAGQFIARKRIDLLLNALSRLTNAAFELELIGSGPLEASLRAQANELLPGRVRWLGRKAIDEIPALIAAADCLVLPSRHDGWGAVISEALMVGTPVICSDACGAAGVIRVSTQGGVFAQGRLGDLEELLSSAVQKGRQPPEQRAALAAWARSLGARRGAEYLDGLLDAATSGRSRAGIAPPWLATMPYPAEVDK